MDEVPTINPDLDNQMQFRLININEILVKNLSIKLLLLTFLINI